MPIGRYLHEWPFTCDSIVLSHVSWKSDLLGQLQKRSLSWEGKWPIFLFVLTRLEALHLCSAGPFSLQVTKNNGIVDKSPLMQEFTDRHITDFIENVIQNHVYGFFSWISAILLKQLKTRLFNLWSTREKCKKEIITVWRSLVLLYARRKKGESQIGRISDVFFMAILVTDTCMRVTKICFWLRRYFWFWNGTSGSVFTTILAIVTVGENSNWDPFLILKILFQTRAPSLTHRCGRKNI